MVADGGCDVTLSGSSFLAARWRAWSRPARNQADPVLPRAERTGVERFEQAGVRRNVRRSGRGELRLCDDGIPVGLVKLVPVGPSFELGDSRSLGVGELLGAACHFGTQNIGELG